MDDSLWFAKQARFLDDPAVVELGAQHGPGGPLLVDALLGLAKLAGAGGRVEVGFTALARRCFLEHGTQAREILLDAERLGVIEMISMDDLRCQIVFPKWTKWQEIWRDKRRRARSENTPETSSNGGVAAPWQERGSTVASPVARRTELQNNRTTEQQKAKESSLRSDSPGESKRRKTGSKTVDQDALPQNVPAHLVALAPVVLATLSSLYEQRGGTVPTTRAVGLVLVGLPDRDHRAVLEDLEHWALAGNGQNKPVKDWTATYRTFLRRAPAARPLSLVPGAPPVSEREIAELYPGNRELARREAA